MAHQCGCELVLPSIGFLSECCKQTSVRPLDDGLVEEWRDGVNLPQLPHLSVWTEPISPSLSDCVQIQFVS